MKEASIYLCVRRGGNRVFIWLDERGTEGSGRPEQPYHQAWETLQCEISVTFEEPHQWPMKTEALQLNESNPAKQLAGLKFVQSRK